MNWTALGAVMPVKDQGQHGYCGTFGRVGACEGQLAIKKGLLVSLAEEELIDCIGWDQDQVSRGRSGSLDAIRRLPVPLAVFLLLSQWLYAHVYLPL